MIFKKTYLLLVILCCFFTSQAQFTLQAGSGHTNYQWHDASAGMSIAGATASTYTASMPGVYYATFNDIECGANATEYFVLTGNNDTNITLKASQQNATYQWSKNNNPIAGATADSLNIVSTPTMQYYYAQSTIPGCSKKLPGFYVYHMGLWLPQITDLLTFDAELTADRNRVKTYWTVLENSNSGFYIVEQSVNLNNWKFIGSVVANTSTANPPRYEMYDNDPAYGRSYYRLKVVEKNSRYYYSEVRTIIRPKSGGSDIDIQVYPNPFQNKFTIAGSNDELYEIAILNAVGQTVRRITTKSNDEYLKITVDLSSLADGVYIVRTFTQQIKVLKKD